MRSSFFGKGQMNCSMQAAQQGVPVVLGRQDIHIWKVDIAPFRERTETLYDALPEDEQARADQYIFPERRTIYVVVRSVLRRVLGICLKRCPSSIRLAYGAYGKPELADDRSLSFNVSHSGDKAVIAVSRGIAVGVDLEKLTIDLSFLGIASSMFSHSECLLLESLHDVEERASCFFKFWTRREAFLKALGTGLATYDIKHINFDKSKQIAVAAPMYGKSALLGRQLEFSQIVLQDFVSFPGYVSAVAFNGGTRSRFVHTHTFPVSE